MAELADAQDLGSCGDSVWVQVPLPAPRRSKLRCTASTGTAERLCLLTFVPLRLLLLSNPNPLRWASDLFFCAGGWEGGKFRRLFLRSKKGRHPLRYIRSSFQNRSRRLRVCVLGGVCFASFAPPFKPEAIGFGFVFWEASVSLRLCLLLTRSRRVRVWGGRFRLCGGYILRLRGGRLCRIWRP